ncbi:MAG: DegT/DnrJ/EryC1/StrS family aminotransferase [Trebonia sp.]
MVDFDLLDDVCAANGSGDVFAVARLEDSLAELTDFPYAVAVSSGTAAVASLLWAVGVRPGHRVGVSALARPETGLAVVALGAEPMFLDTAPDDSFGLDTGEIEAAVEAGCTALVPVPMWGYWNEDAESLARARAWGCHIVVDAAEAPFLLTSPRLGDQVDGMALSLHGSTPLKAGEGGASFTVYETVAAAVAALRSFGQGSAPRARHLEASGPYGGAFGVNLRINGLGAAWCLDQVRRVTEVRRQLEQDRLVADFCFRRARVPFVECHVAASVTRHGLYGYAVVCADERDRARLSQRLIDTGIEPDIGTSGHGLIFESQVFTDHRRPCPRAAALARRVVAVRNESLRTAVKRGLAA